MATATNALQVQSGPSTLPVTTNKNAAPNCGAICGLGIGFLAVLPIAALITTAAVIKQVFFVESSFKKQSLKPENFSAIVNKRAEETKQKIIEFAKKAKIANPEKVALLIGASPLSPVNAPGAFGKTTKGFVVLPAQFLIKREDLPKDLNLEDLNSGKISEDEWLEKFQDWLFNKELKTYPKSYSLLSVNEKTNFKTWLHLFRNPDYERMMDFALAHEIGHVKHSDTYYKGLGLLCSLFIALGVAAAIVASIVLFLPLSTFSTVVLAIVFGNISFIISFKLFHKLLEKSHQDSETKADAIAIELTQDPEGGVKLFQSMQETFKDFLAKNPALAQGVISPEGDNLKDIEHPSLSKRIAYLKVLKDLIPNRPQVATV